MNDKEMTQQPNEPDVSASDLPSAAGDAPLPPPLEDDPGADIDAALAAVASLSVMSDRDADALARDNAAAPPEAAPRRTGRAAFPAPPLTPARRGTFGAIAAGLLLIIGGGWWTYLNLTGEPIDPRALALAVSGGVVIAALAAWLGGGRWARGLLFSALTLGGLTGLLALLALVPELDAALVYPLVLAVPGLACLLTALLGRPVTPRLLLPAAVLIAAAVTGIAYNAGLIPPLDLAALLPPS
jgi:hypothetical protein